MANQVPLVIADFETTLSGAIAAGATSFTLASATDDDGVALAAGKYCFTLNNGKSTKQYLIGQLNGTDVTSVVSVDRRGNETSGAAFQARSGSPVIISDFATIQRVADILRGQETLDGDNPIIYDTTPTISNALHLATKAYVDSVVTGGTLVSDNLIIPSAQAVAGEAVAAGDWVFFDTSDQECYLIDADTAAEVDASYIGVALGTGSDGVAITGGIQTAGVYTTTGLTAGAVYYLSNTPGEISSSPGTTERAIGVALSTTKLLMNFTEKRIPTADEKGAMAGVNNSPSSSNQFVTTDDLSDPTVKPPQVVTFTSSGTWTKDAGLKYIVVEGVGGGGGGGADTSGSKTGGSGAGYFRKLILASALGATETVTIGAAGAYNGGNLAGSNGGNTSFGAHCTANGGVGGGASVSAGGTATGGDINIQGQASSEAIVDGNQSSTGYDGGIGGSSMLGHGGAWGTSPASGYGAGGSGGSTDTRGVGAGTAGTAGIVIVTEYYS